MNKDEKKTIYEIYRACRLCGAGAGYKMPIIQNVIQIDTDDEVELKEKIKDCVQIEVDQDDRMPPLICELCVDKVNDFYDFMKLCQRTNKMTRLRLGLPLQLPSRTSQPDQNCILDVTETVYVNSDSENESLAKSTAKSKPKPKSVKAREKVKLKIETQSNREATKFSSRESSPGIKRETRRKRSISPRHVGSPRHSVSPKRTTRQSRSDDFVFEQLQDDLNLLKLRQPPKSAKKEKQKERETHRSEKPKDAPKEAKLKEAKTEINDMQTISKQKRHREDSIDSAPPVKKTKPEETVEYSERKYPCNICGREYVKIGNLAIHMKQTHSITQPIKPEETAESSERKFPCTICGRVFLNNGNLQYHMKHTHSTTSNKTQENQKKPGPKSRTTQPTQTKPEPKTKKLEPTITTPENSKKRKNSVASKDKVKEDRGKEEKVNKEKLNKEDEVKKKEDVKQQNRWECRICGSVMKNHQSLAHHNLRDHLPLFTPKSQACDACETWFQSEQQANEHHNKHTTENIPYTCNKCYGDYNDMSLYELHFTNNECIPTYESPDVKCDECWRAFPTYKLLEDHRCPGEAARPGGKCSKCNKTYSLLKNQVIHEMKCTGKRTKKTSEEPIDSDVADKMLPMQVRIVRCDTLLKRGKGSSYDVSTVSHTFGLDRNSIYPYFYSKGSYNESFDAMVTIRDEIKHEYSSFVHWDSNDEEEDYFPNKNKNVDSLTVLALKTLFSPQCLGKVPRKLREYAEKNYDSVMSINFSDIKSNIESIINDLGRDESDSNSNSILNENRDSAKLFDSLFVKHGDKNDTDVNKDVEPIGDDKINNLGNDENHSTNESSLNDDEKSEKENDRTDEPNEIGRNDKLDAEKFCTEINDSQNAEESIYTQENDITNVNNKDFKRLESDDSKVSEENDSKSQEIVRDDSTNVTKSPKNVQDESKNNLISLNTDHTTQSDINDEESPQVVLDTTNKQNDIDGRKSPNMVQSDETINIQNDVNDRKSPNMVKSDDTIHNDKFTNQIQNDINDTESPEVRQDNTKNLDADNIEENEIDNKIEEKMEVSISDITNDVEKLNKHSNLNISEKMDVDTQIVPNDTEKTVNNEVIKLKDAVSSENSSQENSFCDKSYSTEKSEINGDGVSLNSFNSGIRSNLDINEDTKDLMDEIDKQIGENTKLDKIKNKNDDLTSLDLDAVSDDEINFD